MRSSALPSPGWLELDEHCTQRFARAMIETVDRALAFAEPLRNLACRKPGYVAQDQHSALICIELFQRRSQELSALEFHVPVAIVTRTDLLAGHEPAAAQVV